MGVAGTTLWRSEALEVMAPGETMHVGPYTLRFDGVTQVQGPNYPGDAARNWRDGRRPGGDDAEAGEARLSRRRPGDSGHRPSAPRASRDLYLALGDDRGNGRWTMRAYVSPLAPFIWLGALVMALGGALKPVGSLRVQGRRAGAGRAARRMKRVVFLFSACWRRRLSPRRWPIRFPIPPGSARPRAAAAIALPGLPGRKH